MTRAPVAWSAAAVAPWSVMAHRDPQNADVAAWTVVFGMGGARALACRVS
jgi:hypothetical protein